MKKLLLSLMLLLAAGSSVELSACPVLKQIGCGAAADACAVAKGTADGFNYGDAWTWCYNSCCNS